MWVWFLFFFFFLTTNFIGKLYFHQQAHDFWLSHCWWMLGATLLPFILVPWGYFSGRFFRQRLWEQYFHIFFLVLNKNILRANSRTMKLVNLSWPLLPSGIETLISLKHRLKVSVFYVVVWMLLYLDFFLLSFFVLSVYHSF